MTSPISSFHFYEELKKIIPNIPDNCSELSINLRFDDIVFVEASFYAEIDNNAIDEMVEKKIVYYLEEVEEKQISFEEKVESIFSKYKQDVEEAYLVPRRYIKRFVYKNDYYDAIESLNKFGRALRNIEPLAHHPV